MTPTSDERRVVAERLREYGNDTLKDGSLLRTLKDVTGAGSWRYVLDALADLIDPIPTCHAKQDYDRDEPIQGRWWKCDRCGEHFIYERGLAPRFCPECGARVAERGEG